jgi:tryptophan synthase alpha chain
MTSIAETFQRMRKQDCGTLIGYLTGGDPEPKLTPLLAEALIRGGIDILELGIPFSDPIADGPTIQAASVRALNSGTTPRNVLDLAGEIRKKHDLPIIIMTYYNPIFKMGLKKFFKLAETNGINGLIVPDLPIEEATEYCNVAKAYAVDTIFLAAPSTSTQRLIKIMEYTSGFLYLVSHFGVTGEKSVIDKSTIQLIKKVLSCTAGRIPLAVGFGVSTPEHVRCIIENGADGVIVGSTFVNIVYKNQGNLSAAQAEIEATAIKMKKATLH